MLYLLVVFLPTLIVGLYTGWLVKSTFSKYSQVGSFRGLTGAQAASLMLRQNGIYDVIIEETQGFLSDHYDPSAKALRLSPDVYHGQSISAIGVACHEAGHALQHAQSYLWLNVRSFLVPIASFCSHLWTWIMLIGCLLSFNRGLILVGVAVFAVATIFSLVTLPVEYDASARAKKAILSSGFLTREENEGASKVLNAAYLTYVAAVFSAFMTLLYYLYRAGLIGGNRSED